MRTTDKGVWELVALENVVVPTERRDPTKSPDDPFIYVDISSVDSATGTIVNPKEIQGREAPSRARKVIRSGDVIFATTRPYLRNTAQVPNRYDDQICSTGFCVLRARRESIEPSFLYYLCRSNVILDQVLPKMRGASYPAVTDSDILTGTIPLPPLDEQRRIVARIEALFDHIKEARRLRLAAKEDVEGVLETALEQVWDEVYAKSPDILQLAEFASVFNGRASGPGESGVRVFKTRHVYPFDLRQTDPSYMKSEQVAKCPLDRFLRSDDVVVCNIARGTLGRVCHVDKAEENWTVDTQIMILRARERCLGRWLFYYLYSRRGQAEILAREKGIAFADKRGQTHLYPREMKTVPIPLPPLSEQRRIVEYLDSVQSQVAELKCLQAQSAAELERLGEAVLARAFRGEL